MTAELNDLKEEIKNLTPRKTKQSFKGKLDLADMEEESPTDGSLNRKELERLLLERTEESEECKDAFYTLQQEATELQQESQKMM